MKLLEKEKVNVASKGHARSRALVAPRAPVKPSISVRARVVSRPAPRRTAALAALCNRVVAFAAITGLTYFGSTLGGYVMLERARQATRHGQERATFARSEAREARASIEALTNPSALRAWAAAHDFVGGETEAPKPPASGYVARL